MSLPFPLQAGEEPIQTLLVTPRQLVFLTNRRVVLWERRAGVENITPIGLEEIRGARVREERGSPLHLLGGIGLAVVGAPLLSWLPDALTTPGLREKVAPLALGSLGLALVVGGLVLLGLSLGRLLFPAAELVLRGNAEIRLYLPSPTRASARQLVRKLWELRRELREEFP